MASNLLALLALSGALSAAACGGASDDNLFDHHPATPSHGTLDAGSGSGGLEGAGGSPAPDPVDDAGGGGHAEGGAVAAASGGGSSGRGGAGGSAGNPVSGKEAGPPCTTSRFYLDVDGDGFGDKKRYSDACDKPAGHVTNADDCYDGNEKAHPGQTELFGVDRGDGSYDYDCDGESTPSVTTVGHCGTFPFCSGTPGWKEASPACGASTTWLDSCTGLTTICGQKTETRLQLCL